VQNSFEEIPPNTKEGSKVDEETDIEEDATGLRR
jgi:hypothetical protein